MLKSELIARLNELPDGVVYDQWGRDLVSVTVDPEGTPDGSGIVLNIASLGASLTPLSDVAIPRLLAHLRNSSDTSGHLP